MPKFTVVPLITHVGFFKKENNLKKHKTIYFLLCLGLKSSYQPHKQKNSKQLIFIGNDFSTCFCSPRIL